MRLSLIVAYAEKRVIGAGGGLPWHLPADLRHFKRTTLGHAVIMGGATFREIRRPLPGRRNIIITRSPIAPHDQVETAGSIEQAIALASSDRAEDEPFIIGGGQIYRAALDRVQRMYITRIHAEIQGDTTFPDWDRQAFTLVSEEHHAANEENEFAMDFFVYDRA